MESLIISYLVDEVCRQANRQKLENLITIPINGMSILYHTK